MKLQLVAVGTKMPDWVQTGFSEYLRRFPKDMPFELWRSLPVSAVRTLISNASSKKRAR